MAKTLLLYYTFEGNTGFAAEELQKVMDVTAERLIVDREPPRKGARKFFSGGLSAITGNDPGLHPLENDPNAFDNVIIAYPVWAGTYPPAIAELLRRCPITGKNLYAIVCSSSGRAAKSVERLSQACGGSTLCDYLSLVDPLKHKEEAAARIAEFAAEIR
ncbi:MAG: flavodoxin family protein [Oscillospiraceae bacterium]|nr:flavodoxin family protein [Oscillospiraceae bacterium]